MTPSALTPIPVTRAAQRVGIVALVAFLPSLLNQFALDDLVHIVQNEQIRSVGRGTLAFFEPTAPGNLFRPFVTFVFSCLYALEGLQPLLFHAHNIILHSAVSVLVLYLLRMLVDGEVAYASALLFALHPIHSEVVANVTGAFELWCAFWSLLCLWQFLKLFGPASPTGNALVSALLGIGLTFLLALLSKESAFVVPLLMLLLGCYARETLPGRNTRLLLTGTLSGVGLLYCAMRVFALGSMLPSSIQTDFLDNPLIDVSPDLRAFNALALLGRYAALCLFPWELSADYSYAHLAPVLENTAESFLGHFAFSLTFGLALLLIAGRNAYSLGAAWFLVAFTITANFFFPIGTIFGERLAYLPSVGALCCLGAALMNLPSRFHQRSVLAVLSVAFLGMNFVQSQVWMDNENLYEHQVTISDRSARTRVNYAVVLRNRADYGGARSEVAKALDIYPAYAQAYFVLATIAVAEGQLAEADNALDAAIDIDPQHSEAVTFKGKLAFNRGALPLAEKLFQEANRLSPRSSEPLIGLLAVFVKSGRVAEARQLRALLVRRHVPSTDLVALGKALDTAEVPQQ